MKVILIGLLLFPLMLVAQTTDLEDSMPLFSAEIMPRFPGGNENLMEFVQSNTLYPESAMELGIEGMVYVQFAVDTLGKVVDVEVLKAVWPDIDSEAVRVVRSMPDWIPGEEEGRKVKMTLRIPVLFSYRGPRSIEPVYPEGFSKMHEYVRERFVYPKQLIRKGCPAGILKMQVNWDSEGTIISVVGEEQNALNKAMIRVIEGMPAFKPATKDGMAIPYEGTLSFPYFCPEERREED